jgi:hypothetical protein
MKTVWITLSTIALLSYVSRAHAQYWYVGGGLGGAQVEELCEGAPAWYCDDEGVAIRAFGGYRATPFFAVEASFDAGGDFLTPGARAAGYDGSTTASFFGVNAIGFVPVGSRVAFYGGLSGAIAYATTEVSDYAYRVTYETDCRRDWYDDDWDYYCTTRRYYEDEYDSDTSLAGGAVLGVEVQITRRFHLRAQVQRYFSVDGGLAFGDRRDVNVATLNALFAFRGRQ